MVAQRERLAPDAAAARGDVVHPARRLHVAVLAVPPLSPGRAVQPFRVRRVDRHAEHYPLVTGGTIAAVAIERGVRILPAVDVVERPEEQLPTRGGPEQLQQEPPVR